MVYSLDSSLTASSSSNDLPTTGPHNIRGNQAFIINVDKFGVGGGLDGVTVKVADTHYEEFPVSPNMFPIEVDGRRYRSKLTYRSDSIKLSMTEESTGEFVEMDVDGLSLGQGDMAVLYLIGQLDRKT